MYFKGHKPSSDYRRIFILGAKELTSADLRAEFERFGTITDIRMLKNSDRENKGLNYITYTKASEAALAIDEMNGKTIKDFPKPVRVVLANDRAEGSVRDPDEDDKMKRLFIIVPNGYEQSDLEREFNKYGDIEYVKLLRRNQNNLQLAYVKYLKAYHAALALEECDPSYKAVFADTKSISKRSSSGDRRGFESSDSSKYRRHDGGGRMGGGGGGGGGGGYYNDGDRYDGRGSSNMSSLSSPSKSSSLNFGGSSYNSGHCCLEAKLVPGMTQEQVYKLFDVVPGLMFCNYDSASGCADVKYISQSMANHAKEKLGQLEYPLGYPVMVNINPNPPQSLEGPQDIRTLVHTIEKATEYLKQSGIAAPMLGNFMGSGGQSGLGGDFDNISKYTNVQLPSAKPLAPENSPCLDRLFIVSYPSKIPIEVLTDIFCRFGGLINVYYLPNKKCGFAKFNNKESAQEALRTLHLQTICGCTLKVIQAEPPGSIGSHDQSGYMSFEGGDVFQHQRKNYKMD